MTPWLAGTALVEVAAFVASLAYLRLQHDEDVVSYTLWGYAVEFETRPEMADILKPVVQSFFGFLRSTDNPNGLWAWLAEDSGRVQDQLRVIQGSEMGWMQFAYGSTAFDDWVATKARTKPDDTESPRLDYLVLDSLAEKGPPRAASDILSTWFQMLREAVQHALERFLDRIRDQFERAGAYTREVLDQAGNQIPRHGAKPDVTHMRRSGMGF